MFLVFGFCDEVSGNAFFIAVQKFLGRSAFGKICTEELLFAFAKRPEFEDIAFSSTTIEQFFTGMGIQPHTV